MILGDSESEGLLLSLDWPKIYVPKSICLHIYYKPTILLGSTDEKYV